MLYRIIYNTGECVTYNGRSLVDAERYAAKNKECEWYWIQQIKDKKPQAYEKEDD